MNRQQIYDRVKRHLLKQGVKSGVQPYYEPEDDCDDYKPEFECKYRMTDENGRVLKCAIGCLIPLRNYDPAFEGDNAQSDKVRGAIPPSLGIAYEDADFLNALQTVHDGSEPDEWPAALERVARRYQLTP